jgi:predicted DNA-binding ribbon-helix-helix protein
MSRSPVVKHSIMLVGHKTSVSLEDQFWDGLHEIALNKGVSTTTLIERIDTNRVVHNLSSAIRLFVLDYFKNVRQSADIPPRKPMTAK